MEIPRDVILDLLPLYQTGEIRADTKRLVEDYLRADPELAGLAKEPHLPDRMKETSMFLSERARLEMFKQAKLHQFIRNAILAAVAFVAALIVLWQIAYWYRF